MNASTLPMKPLALAAASLLLAAGGGTALLVHAQDNKAPAAAAPRPALTVTVTTPLRATVATAVVANGNIAAWQEAIVGAEANGMRLAEVLVNVGDVVRKGQTLARFDSAVAHADPLRSRLCRLKDDYIYEITLLRRDGKVMRVLIRADDGSLVDERTKL